MAGGRWRSLLATLTWLFTVRLWCRHPRARFAKKVGNMSKFYCPDCDDHHYRRNSWSDLSS